MQSENLLESDASIVENPPKKSRSKKLTVMIWFHSVAFLFGLAALIWLIYTYWGPVSESLAKVGWGFALIVALNLIRHLLRALSMYLAVGPEHRKFKYRSAVAARLGGDAVSVLTFTGPFLGDATKAVLLRKNIPLTHGASAVIIDNILYYASVVIVILTGIGTLLVLYGSNGRMMSNILLAIVVLALLIFAALLVAIRFRVTPLTRIIKQLERRHLAPRFILLKQKAILDVENNVYEFYTTRRRDFFTVFGISMFVHVVSVTEVFLAMRLLGFESTAAAALIIESLTKVINVVFSFVPGTIGVYEGGNGLILLSLGYAAETGIALGLVRHGAIFFSTFIGILILLWRTLQSGAKHLADPEP
ncbi:MAG: lysylphosphatidylglycerol synthase domain-containing protein [Acidobacteriota bacterium]